MVIGFITTKKVSSFTYNCPEIPEPATPMKTDLSSYNVPNCYYICWKEWATIDYKKDSKLYFCFT